MDMLKVLVPDMVEPIQIEQLQTKYPLVGFSPLSKLIDIAGRITNESVDETAAIEELLDSLGAEARSVMDPEEGMGIVAIGAMGNYALALSITPYDSKDSLDHQVQEYYVELLPTRSIDSTDVILIDQERVVYDS